jgi:polynucleotide kinase-phosphatase
LNDRRDDHGPFDVIGDVHGCRSELETLLTKLDYRIVRDEQGRAVDAEHPGGRRALFLGDLVDRGPDTPGVLRLAMGMTAAGHALTITGNHEHKLVRALRPERGGRRPEPSHGLQQTLDQLAAEPDDFVTRVRDWCRDLIAHLVLDDGRLVVAHAGLKEAYHGRASGRVRSFALYGDTTGETDEYGLPVRLPWAEDYRGAAMVLYGHTPVPEAVWLNNTMCLDTGCVFGGRLTALRYPEKEIVDVPAEQIWCQPAKPFLKPERAADDLELGDVLGRRVIDTAGRGRVTIAADQAAGAFEVMSRFALHPRWLGYLPPTMAPARASSQADHLEHPDTAFDEYADAGVATVICEEKHMGSRAVITVCADAEAAARHFGASERTDEQPRTGVIHTRTGRAFAGQAETEELLARVRTAISAAGLWNQLDADWLMLDAELLPWSLKADPLLRDQYAATGAAAEMMLPTARDQLRRATARGVDVDGLDQRVDHRAETIAKFIAAYRRYQWPTQGWQGAQIAPFQLLAAGSADDARTFADRDHGWHLELADRLVAADPGLFRTTRRLLVRTGSQDSVAAGVDWWTELTDAGGEGMVVKPYLNLPAMDGRSTVQPGLKVRGREYLRLIYGPDYLRPDELARLKKRNLGHKRSLAWREYALGLESLRRLTSAEPLWRVHEAVFAVLALESDAVDPRL